MEHVQDVCKAGGDGGLRSLARLSMGLGGVDGGCTPYSSGTLAVVRGYNLGMTESELT